MQFGVSKSQIFPVSSGLPQGTPLSSVLFYMYTADLIVELGNAGTRRYTFVNDIIINVKGNIPMQVVEQL